MTWWWQSGHDAQLGRNHVRRVTSLDPTLPGEQPQHQRQTTPSFPGTEGLLCAGSFGSQPPSRGMVPSPRPATDRCEERLGSLKKLGKS